MGAGLLVDPVIGGEHGLFRLLGLILAHQGHHSPACGGHGRAGDVVVHAVELDERQLGLAVQGRIEDFAQLRIAPFPQIQDRLFSAGRKGALPLRGEDHVAVLVHDENRPNLVIGHVYEIHHAVHDDVDARHADDLSLGLDGNGAGDHKRSGEGVGLQIREVEAVGLQGARIPGALPDREGEGLAAAVQLCKGLIVGDEVDPVGQPNVAGVNFVGVFQHGQHGPRKVAQDPQILGSAGIDARFGQVHDGGHALQRRIRRIHHGLGNEVPVGVDALRQGLEHIDVVDHLGKVVLYKLCLQRDVVDHGAGQNAVHGFLGDLGDGLLLLRPGIADDPRQRFAGVGAQEIKDERHDEEHDEHEQDGLLLQSPGENPYDFFHASTSLRPVSRASVCISP